MNNTESIDLAKHIYNENNPDDLRTIFGQLSRIAVNKAVYLSIVKMIEDNNIQVSDTLGNFIQEGHVVDFSLSIRRQLDSNKIRGGTKDKVFSKQVISLKGLVETLDNTDLEKRLVCVKKLTGTVVNKVFAHNDRGFAENGAKGLAESEKFENALRDLHLILIDAGRMLAIDVPDTLLPTYQYDWAEAFNKPWKNEDFDYSDIWD